jgi:hypothetical protein
VNIEEFHEIDLLPSGATLISSIGVDFNDKTQPALFEISFDGRQLSTPLSISCHVGELIEQKFLNEQDFNQNLGRRKDLLVSFFIELKFLNILVRLRGMNEVMDNLDMSEAQMKKLNFTTIQNRVFQCANVSSVPSGSGDSTIYR